MSKGFKLFIVVMLVLVGGVLATVLSSLHHGYRPIYELPESCKNATDTAVMQSCISPALCSGTDLSTGTGICSEPSFKLSGFPYLYYDSSEKEFLSFVASGYDGSGRFYLRQFTADIAVWTGVIGVATAAGYFIRRKYANHRH